MNSGLPTRPEVIACNEVSSVALIFLIEHNFASVYVQPWYLHLATNSKARLLLQQESSEVLAALPFCLGRRLGFPFIYQPHFSQQYGYLGQSNSVPIEWISNLVNLASAGVYAFSEVNVLPKLPDYVNLRKGLTHVLPLNVPYSELIKGYNQNHKRNLAKANNAGLLIENVNNPESVEAMIALFMQDKGSTLHDVKPIHYRIIRAIALEAIRRGVGFIKVVRHYGANSILAAGLFITHAGRLTYLFGAGSAEGKGIGASHALLNAVIAEFAGKSGYHTLDFEGGTDVGVGRFYKGFGATESSFDIISWNRYPWPLSRLFPF